MREGVRLGLGMMVVWRVLRMPFGEGIARALGRNGFAKPFLLFMAWRI